MQIGNAEFAGEVLQIALQPGEDVVRVVDQVHLVDGGDDVTRA